MIKNSHYLIGLLLITLISLSFYKSDNPILSEKTTWNEQHLDSITDGPYVFIRNDSLIEKYIVDGALQSKVLGLDAYKTQYEPEAVSYKKVNSIAAFSDLHGQYDVTLSVLQNNGIINNTHDWAFGKGHLVIVGDIFDRGTQVTEILWFIYNLEKQALKAGGKVHYLLGNHEYMVMQNDLRYLNPKYKQSAQLMDMPLASLYDNKTVLGRWLRSKATVIKINDNMFVHGGISQAFIADHFDLEQTNQKMRRSLLDTIAARRDSVYNKYFNSDGPIWYRGYFKEDFTKNNINEILSKLRVKHIVVGHTSQTEITSLFRNKVLAVDSSIKLGESGEILIIENGKYFRGTIDGSKIPLK